MILLRNLKTILLLTIFIAVTSCHWGTKKSEAAWSELPEVASLSNLKQTDFVITLENQLTENKNIIYAPAFLYAWDKVKEELKFPIISDTLNSPDFNLLNNSVSHENSLASTEYVATGEIVNGDVIAKAFFEKTLPFDTKLQALDEPIRFDTTLVSAFGMYDYDEEAIKISQILYYKDDEHFILKLIPKDKQNEIILAKGVGNYQTLKNAIKLTNDLITEGKKEQSNTALLWKYQIVPEDIFTIPVIKFNIETQYKNLEGQKFRTSDNKLHSFEIAYQRTGFILNENGAVIKSEAAVAADSSSASPTITHPKKMVFDKPFLIILKRVDKTNPYFVMKVANAELLTRK